MIKTLSLICNSEDCKGQLKEFIFMGVQEWLYGVRLFDIYKCPTCNNIIETNFSEFYLNLAITNKEYGEK